MQVSQLSTIKEKLIGSTMAKYMSAVAQSGSVSAVQAATTTMIKEAMDVVYPDKKIIIKDNAEPQSEQEDPAVDLELLDAIIKEVKNFNEATKNIGVTQQEDLIELKSTRDMIQL